MFYDNTNDRYIYQKGFTKLASVGEVCEEYSKYLETFLKGWRCNKVIDYWWKGIETPSFECNYYSKAYYITDGGKHFKVYWYANNTWHKTPTQSYDNLSDFESSEYNRTHVSKDYVKDKQFVKPVFVLENGEEIEYE